MPKKVRFVTILDSDLVANLTATAKSMLISRNQYIEEVLKEEDRNKHVAVRMHNDRTKKMLSVQEQFKKSA